MLVLPNTTLGRALLRGDKTSWGLVSFCWICVDSTAEFSQEGGREEGTKTCSGICQSFSKDSGFMVIPKLCFLLPLLSISRHSSNHQLCTNWFPWQQMTTLSLFPFLLHLHMIWKGQWIPIYFDTKSRDLFDSKSRDLFGFRWVLNPRKMCLINYEQTPEEKKHTYIYMRRLISSAKKYKLYLILPKGSEENATYLKMQLIICQVLL